MSFTLVSLFPWTAITKSRRGFALVAGLFPDNARNYITKSGQVLSLHIYKQVPNHYYEFTDQKLFQPFANVWELLNKTNPKGGTNPFQIVKDCSTFICIINFRTTKE